MHFSRVSVSLLIYMGHDGMVAGRCTLRAGDEAT